MENMDSKAPLKVKDLATASFLVASGIPVVDIEREGKTCYFIFKGRERALELCREFWSGNALVNAKAFSDATRSLKDLIFSIPI